MLKSDKGPEEEGSGFGRASVVQTDQPLQGSYACHANRLDRNSIFNETGAQNVKNENHVFAGFWISDPAGHQFLPHA
jgi:hypothetical protein